MLKEIWPKSIKPTLLTTKGRAYVFSTPDGVDEENFFYAICNNKSLGFIEHHAPTSSNPFVPPEELERERQNNDPRVFRQEFWPSSSTGPQHRCSTSANGLRVKVRISLSITPTCARPYSPCWTPPLKAAQSTTAPPLCITRSIPGPAHTPDDTRLGCCSD
jgi:hypothetical protein